MLCLKFIEAVTQVKSGLGSHIMLRGCSCNTTNSAISLLVNNVIPLLIGRSKQAPMTLVMYHVGQGTRPCPFPVTGNGHGRVTEPKGDQFSSRNLRMVPNCSVTFFPIVAIVVFERFEEPFQCLRRLAY